MYCSLDKIDIAANGKPEGPEKVAYQTDHRPAEAYEEERELSTLFALARVINPKRIDQEDNVRHGVIYVAVARPPDTHRLVAGVPHRGLLLVTDGIAPPDTLSRVIAVCEGCFTDTDGEPSISPLPFLVEDGKVVGFLRLGEGDDAPVPLDKRSYFARLFGRN